jgi:glycine/D-amino acid oxidase-like deaminating enzyme
VPGSERVIVATGHNMLGLSLGAATGAIVADVIEHGPVAAPMALGSQQVQPAEGQTQGTWAA